jgi:glycosyltransferase involved in cell wall biosynthesis
MKTIVNEISLGMQLREKRVFWLSLLVFGFSNVVSETEMAKCLTKDGADVYLFAMGSKRDVQGISSTHIVPFPMKYVPLVTPLLYIMALFVSMPFYIIIKNPDYVIVDERTAIAGFALKLLMKGSKARFVLDIRSTPITAKSGPRLGMFRANLHAFLFRVSIVLAKAEFDGITILTKLMKKQICQEFDIDPEFVGVWTSGVSAELFNPENFSKMEIKKELGLEDKFVVFYHGALGKYRGVDDTIKSIAELKERFNNLVLFILGEGWYEPNLRRLAEEIGAEDRIIFHKKVPYDEVPKYIAMSDVGIVPLPDSAVWRFQCPLKLIEYLAMKKVVIATDIPANREIIAKNKCGIYISSTDPKEIAEAIAFAYSNRETLKEWGASGRLIVEEKYTWEKIAKDFESFLLREVAY